MNQSLSLRMRLTAIILLPLMAVAIIAGLWQLNNARRTAADVFDRSLLSAALAVANDVAISGGDALSLRTRDILSDTSGGRVFYHVYAPDGVIVAGYATPPVGIPNTPTEVSGPTYFEATYQGNTVSGARLQNITQIEGFSGIFTTTVWQNKAVRRAFVRDLVFRSLITILGLIASLALIVWFGVHIGLRPLLDLENAIAKRSSDELSPIQRAVPDEVQGVVSTLNRLFLQVSRSMTAQTEFISNAAHQLRNPIAGVLSLAEAVQSAPNAEEAKRRSADLLDAARETAELSQQLLLLERAKSVSPSSEQRQIDFAQSLNDWLDVYEQQLPSGVSLFRDIDRSIGLVRCDPTLLREAIKNLIDNSVRHGGLEMTTLTVAAVMEGERLHLRFDDNGCGITAENLEAARSRFQTIAPTSGSGLGVSIVEAIAQSHGGTMTLQRLSPGLRVDLVLKV